MLFDKDLDWTSFDLVQRVRNQLCRHLRIKKLKVGHTGTLDPKATGLLIVCTGKATGRIEELQLGEKEYIATLKLGATTPSYDTETAEDRHFETGHLSEALVRQTLATFVGDSLQMPPLFSAIKVDGKRAYNAARRGRQLELAARPVNIPELELLAMKEDELSIRVVCSKGTYIRALARDIGAALKCGAYIVQLRRTRIGTARIEEAMTIDSFLNRLKEIEN